MKHYFLILLVFSVINCDIKSGTNVPIPSKKKSYYGIDISKQQGDIDWSKMKEWNGHKIDFIYIKATEGRIYNDPMYRKHFSEAKKHGFLVGCYHYFKTTSVAMKQFETYRKSVDKNSLDLIPMLDVQEINGWTLKTFHKNLQEFLNLLEEHYGEKPMIYSDNLFYNLYLAGRYKDYPIFIGNYEKNGPDLKDKRKWAIWQFTYEGKVNGISTVVDVDVLNSSLDIKDILLNP